MNGIEREKAVALAAAIEALSDSHARVLARELRMLLEGASISVAGQSRNEVDTSAIGWTEPHDLPNAQTEAPPSSRSGLSMTPEAVRKREERARRKAAAAAQGPIDDRQVAFAFADTSGRVRTRPDGLSLSGSLDRSEGTERGPDGRRGHVRLDPRAIPAACAAIAGEVRPDLGVELVARSWAKFARRNDDAFTSEPRMEAAWQGWIERERAPQVDAAPPSPPPSPPASEQRPIAVHEETTDVHEAQERAEAARARGAVAAELGRRALEELARVSFDGGGRTTQRGAERGAGRGKAPATGDDPCEGGRREASPGVSASPASPAYELPCPLEVARERARASLFTLDVDEGLEAVVGPSVVRVGGLRPPEPRAMSA